MFYVKRYQFEAYCKKKKFQGTLRRTNERTMVVRKWRKLKCGEKWRKMISGHPAFSVVKVHPEEVWRGERKMEMQTEDTFVIWKALRHLRSIRLAAYWGSENSLQCSKLHCCLLRSVEWQLMDWLVHGVDWAGFVIALDTVRPIGLFSRMNAIAIVSVHLWVQSIVWQGTFRYDHRAENRHWFVSLQMCSCYSEDFEPKIEEQF